MEKNEYLRKLHDLAYTANKADSLDAAQEWQETSHASAHVNALLDIVKTLLTAREYEIFLDCFGDFDAFLYNMARNMRTHEEPGPGIVESKAGAKYFTLFEFDAAQNRWFDIFGALDLESVREEVVFIDTPKSKLRIVRHRYDASIPAIAFDLNATGKTALGAIVKI